MRGTLLKDCLSNEKKILSHPHLKLPLSLNTIKMLLSIHSVSPTRGAKKTTKKTH